MYCIKCGVKLADTEKCCPLCGTKVCHPELEQGAGEELFPAGKRPVRKRSYGLQVVVTVAFVLALLIVLLCDLQVHGGVTWSAYVMGALVLGYVVAALPLWFKKSHPVVFVPCDFAVAALYLLFIDLVTGGGWFLPFAFPVVGGIGVIVTAVVTLVHCLGRGKLYIFGGAAILLGGFMLLMEFLITWTFAVSFVGWSLYPLIALVLLGGLLIFLAICRPARETMERKLFF